MVRSNVEFMTMFGEVVRLAKSVDAEAVLLLLENHADWDDIKKAAGTEKVIIASESPQAVAEAAEAGLIGVMVEMKAVNPGSRVAAALQQFRGGITGFDSVIDLDDHLGGSPYATCNSSAPRAARYVANVVNLARIGREGREAVGTFFIVGDSIRVQMCHPASIREGYSRKTRRKVRASAKGIKRSLKWTAIIVAGDGTAAARASTPRPPTSSRGLRRSTLGGRRPDRTTKAVAVAVSESSGTVRIFQSGEVVLRIEPFVGR
jgi:hypothetical protein